MSQTAPCNASISQRVDYPSKTNSLVKPFSIKFVLAKNDFSEEGCDLCWIFPHAKIS